MKNIAIFGATGGIGRALVETFRRENVALFLHGNAGLDALRAELEPDPDFPNVRFFRADLAERRAVDALCAELADAAPRFDAFVDAAGLDLMTPARKAANFDEKLDAIWRIDVDAAARAARFFGKLAQDRPDPGAPPPAVVLFGWDGVERGMEGETAQLYAIAKGAVAAFARSLAQDLAGVARVNVVAPGWIRTAWGAVASEKAAGRGAKESLAGRWGTPAEVASVVRFLISDAAAYVNAQTIPVNGGFSIRK